MKFDIVKNRNIFFGLSGFLVTISLLLIFTTGIPLGIDFTGGSKMQIAFDQEISVSELEQVFVASVIEDKDEEITAVMDKNDLIITYKTFSKEERASFEANLAAKNWGANIVSESNISSSVGEVFKERAIAAVLLTIIAIVLFVAFTFRQMPSGISSWKFGITAIIALVHDILIIIGAFVLLGLFRTVQVDTLFIMALLIVLGFSVNDTIVIFDRIREKMKGQNRSNFPERAEEALWDSMRRSISTSLSTFFILAAMLIFFISFEDLFLFFLALSLGVLVGTYSSIFLATPILVLWHKDKKKDSQIS